MGLFSSNYSKPGPGVDKNAPKKKGLFLYLELFFRKFWKLIQANMLYFLSSIPMLIVLYFAAPFLVVPMGNGLSGAGFDAETVQIYTTIFTVYFCMMVLSFFGSGPASAAFAYILRCFTREQHSWIFSDFKEKFKENFKQAIIVSLVDIFVLAISYTAISFYHSMAAGNAYGMGTIWMFLQVFIIILLLVYTFMHFYIYQLMVTFESTLKQLYKNAIIFAIAFLPMNVFLAGIMLVIGYFLFSLFQPAVSLLLGFLLWFGFVRFPIEFYAARTIQRKVLDQAEKPQKNRSEAE